jgi:Mg-chelatase subunit ChlD
MNAKADSANVKNFELNKDDNFIFAVDVSRSMGAKDCPGGMARIDFLKESVIQFAREAGKYDTDGIDVLPFGHQVDVHQGVTPDNAATIIGALTASQSATDTAGVIRTAWSLHKKGGYEQTVLFVATDGEPSDRGQVMTVIREIAQEVKDPREFCISFLTVGKIEPSLQAFLTELDDNLNAKHDIVDVKELEKVNFMQAFAGALED